MEWIKYDRDNSLCALAREHGIAPGTVDSRIKNWGWDLERALTTPPRQCNRIVGGFKICTGCGEKKPILEYDNKRSQCKPCIKKYNKELGQEKKILVLTHYSGSPPRCALCGEDNISVLCIDHIEGGGTKDRKKKGKIGSLAFHYAVIKAGYPSNLRVLCRNCNWLEWIRVKDEKEGEKDEV